MKKSTRVNAKGILDQVKQKNKPEKAVYTFRLRSELVERFRQVCEKNSVSSTEILEALIEDFISGIK